MKHNIFIMEIELERTFLVKNIPEGLKKCGSIEILDIYIPKSQKHPTLRVRKKGNKYEITKKFPVEGCDSSRQYEYTISLSEEEYGSLKKIRGKRTGKMRYFYPLGEHVAQIDVFRDELKGLVLVDFEFNSIEEKDNFKMPDFCLCDVSQDLPFAGGYLAGMKYKELEDIFKKYNYKKIIFHG